MKFVLFYESADDVRAKAPAQRPAHRAWYQHFVDRGDLLMLGTLEEQEQGSRRGVRRRDPFV